MANRSVLGAWSFLAVVTLGVLVLAGITYATSETLAGRDGSAILVAGGLLVVAILVLVVARPILIPWTVVQLRRAWRHAMGPPRVPQTVRQSASATDAAALGAFMVDAEEVARRAQEVQEILDAARHAERRRRPDAEIQLRS